MGRHLLKNKFQQSLCLILGTPLDFAPVGSKRYIYVHVGADPMGPKRHSTV
jgi:hypothetical protein